jgi:hypothetical protein
MRILTVIFLLMLASVAGPASATDIAGDYVAEGSCPAPDSAYRGTLTIQGTGLFHVLTWRVGDDTIVGRGLESGGRMVAEFRFASGESGLIEMSRVGNGWRGTWAIYGTEILCTETWSPR